MLRFILDTHPDIACPPETNLAGLCAQLAVLWSLAEGAPLSAARGDAPPAVPEAALQGIRHTLDGLIERYVTRRGKLLFCDKSLGTARFAGLLTKIYPAARFICLYRHPMDTIKSGIDAAEPGINVYGSDPYTAGTQAGTVQSLARYWLDNAGLIAAFEKQFAAKCCRVRYEDLVESPDEVARQIFGFVGVRPVPGISELCFVSGHERFGPGDHKIWHTSQITRDRVGRGRSISASLMTPPVRTAINELLTDLGYAHIGADWGPATAPADPRITTGSGHPPGAAPPPGGGPVTPWAAGSAVTEPCSIGHFSP